MNTSPSSVPNGAGKSTFLKLLAGEVHPVPNDETHIRLFGEEQWNVWDVRKRLGMVSHDLQHQYMDQVTGLKVVLSGFYASIGIYGHQDFSYAQIARADGMMEEMGVGFLNDQAVWGDVDGRAAALLAGPCAGA